MAQSSLELKLLISGPSIRQIKLNLKWEICQATLVKSKKKKICGVGTFYNKSA